MENVRIAATLWLTAGLLLAWRDRRTIEATLQKFPLLATPAGSTLGWLLIVLLGPACWLLAAGLNVGVWWRRLRSNRKCHAHPPHA